MMPQVVPSVVLLLILAVTSTKARRAKKSQDKLVQSLASEECITWSRVKVSRPAFFKRWLKLGGAESSAVLLIMQDRIRIVGELPAGERLDEVYPRDGLPLEWIGNKGLGSANMHWFAIGQGEHRLMVTADTGFNAVQSREATADVCRKINPGFRLPSIAQADFALEKNRASLAVMVLCAILGAYALADGIFVNKAELISMGRIPVFSPAVFVFALPAYLYLSRGKVPSRESLALSMLFAACIAFAGIPALKRLDAWLSSGPKAYAYTMTSVGRFSAEDAGPPQLTFDSTRQYWAQFAVGSTHEFMLIHGPLGLWQLDHSTLDPKFRAYYSMQDK